MAIDIIQFQIEQITRILSSIGWKVISTSTEGPTIKITIEAEKKETL